MAGITNPLLPEELSSQTGAEFTGNLLSSLITFFLIAAAVASLFFMIYGSIKWITSGGDRDGLAQAQKTVTSAATGLVITLSIYAILRLIGYFFGIDLLNFDLDLLII